MNTCDCGAPWKRSTIRDCTRCPAACCVACVVTNDDPIAVALKESSLCPNCHVYLVRCTELQAEIVAQAEVQGGFFEITVDYGRHVIEEPTGPISNSATDPNRCQFCETDFEPGWQAQRKAEKGPCPSRDLKKVYKVPRAPFVRWALNRTSGQHLAPEWTNISPYGFKLQNDDRDHTDFMLGAGMSVRAWRDGTDPTKGVCMREYLRVQKELLDFEVAVLCGTGSIDVAPVIHAIPDEEVPPGTIIVIPHAGPEYTVPAISCHRANSKGVRGVVITERGNALAHLVVIGYEHDFRLLMERGALKKYPDGSFLSVSCDRGRITLPRTRLFVLKREAADDGYPWYEERFLKREQ